MKKLILILILLIPTYSCTYEEIINNYYGVVKTDGSPAENELVRMINQYRVSIGLPILIHEKLASSVCRDRNLMEIEQGLHASHDGWSNMIIEARAYEGSHIWAQNYSTAQLIFNAYMISPEEHYRAFENADATHIGTSIINGRNHTIIIRY